MKGTMIFFVVMLILFLRTLGFCTIKPDEITGHVNIPSTWTKISKFAFFHCEELRTVYIPQSVEEIEESSFYGAANLTSVTIPSSVKTLRVTKPTTIFTPSARYDPDPKLV